MLSGVNTHSPLSYSLPIPRSVAPLPSATSSSLSFPCPSSSISHQLNALQADHFLMNIKTTDDQSNTGFSAGAANASLNNPQHIVLTPSQQNQLLALQQQQQSQQQQQLLSQSYGGLTAQQAAAAAQLLIASGQAGLLGQTGLLSQAGLLGVQGNLLSQAGLSANQGGGLLGQSSGLLSGNTGSSGGGSVQHLLIPVSTGNGGQQLVSVPLSLAAGLGNQMQLLATSGGQIIGTSMAGGQSVAGGTIIGGGGTGVGQQNNNNNTGGNAPVHPLLMVGSPLNVLMPQASTNVAAAQSLALRQLSQQQQQLRQQQQQQLAQHQLSQQLLAQLTQLSAAVSCSTAATAVASPAVSGQQQLQPQLIQTSQGSFVVIGSPQLLQQALSTGQTTTTSLTTSTATRPPPTKMITQSLPPLSTTLPASQKLLNLTLALSPQPLAPLRTTVNRTNAVGGVSLISSPTTTVNVAGSTVLANNATLSPNSSNNNGMTPNINQLLPNTLSVASGTGSGTIVDGVNLDEMREFAKQFKIRRLSLGLTQTQVGQALSVTEGPSYSQSAICRFEKLDITPKSAQKIKPVLERWMSLAEERYKSGLQNLSTFVGLEPSKKRKRRTSFTPQALEILNEHFEHSTHPSGEEMRQLAEELDYDREIIRIWFCNKRQILKNTKHQFNPKPIHPLLLPPSTTASSTLSTSSDLLSCQSSSLAPPTSQSTATESDSSQPPSCPSSPSSGAPNGAVIKIERKH